MGLFSRRKSGKGREPCEHREVVERAAAMATDPEAQALAKRRGLHFLNVTWEDVARSRGAALGTNVSDMTLQVQCLNPTTGRYDLACMPVVRQPHFSDRRADVPIDCLRLPVGNHKGAPLEPIGLRELLGDLRRQLTHGESWRGGRTSLLADRDASVLVGAQASYVPVPRDGVAEINPVIFNYLSTRGDPAVLAILCTPQGTSITVIDNERDAFEAGATWGQRIFFNDCGGRTTLTAGHGVGLMLVVEVPLLQKEPDVPSSLLEVGGGTARYCPQASTTEDAEIGHGPVEGPFVEIDDLEIERDPMLPVRVTVQLCVPTSTGVASPADLDQVAAEIGRIHADADYLGGLLVEPAGRSTTISSRA